MKQTTNIKVFKYTLLGLVTLFLIGPADAEAKGVGAHALPQGLQVQGGGKADISYSGKQLTISPKQPHTLIHEGSFNIGSGYGVHHVHADPSYITVHSVQTATASKIAGTVSATAGSVVLVNPYGVAFADGARIDVPGHFIASTHGMTASAEQAFLETGRLIFDGPSHGGIVQGGSLTFSAQGLAFISPFVAQQGVIVGRAHPLSHKGGNTVTVDFMDRRFNFGLSEEQQASVSQKVVDTEGDVVMTVGAVDKMLRNINPSKADPATKLKQMPGGDLYLIADDGNGKVLMEGTLDLNSGQDATMSGAGSLYVAGEDVHVSSTARIRAQGFGDHRGGRLNFGVDNDYTALRDMVHKGRTRSTTHYVRIGHLTIDDGAIFNVSASGQGAGGQVYFVSRNSSRFGSAHVDISSQKGRGGLLDFSGLGNLQGFEQVSFASSVDGNPHTGTILFDPSKVRIADTHPVGTQLGKANLLTSWVNQVLETSNLYIATVNAGEGGVDLIEIAGNLNWESDRSLSLVADRIKFLQGGAVTMTGSGTLNLRSHSRIDSQAISLINGFEGESGTLFQLGQSGSLNTATKNAAGLDGNFTIKRGETVVMGPDPDITHYKLVFDAAGLQAMAGDLSGSYALADHIDMTSFGNFNPVGHFDSHAPNGFTTAFKGKLTGTDYKGGRYMIQNLTIDNSAKEGTRGAGLFGATDRAEISSLILTNPSVRHLGGFNVGSLIGRMRDGSISGVGATKTNQAAWDIEGEVNVGGLVGDLESSGNFGLATITNSTSAVHVRTTLTQGGSIGGLVGSSWDGGSIDSSQATGKVGDGNGVIVGGLVGHAQDTLISLSSATGPVYGGSRVGGLVGQMSQTIGGSPMLLADNYSNSNVTGGRHTGALIGLWGDPDGFAPLPGGVLQNAHSTGNVISVPGIGVEPPIWPGLIGGLTIPPNVGDLSNLYYSGTYPVGPPNPAPAIGTKLSEADAGILENYPGFDSGLWRTASPPVHIVPPATPTTQNDLILGVVAPAQEEVNQGNELNDGQGNDGDPGQGNNEGDHDDQVLNEGDDSEDDVGEGDDEVDSGTTPISVGNENLGESLSVRTVEDLKRMANLTNPGAYQLVGINSNAKNSISTVEFKNEDGEKVILNINWDRNTRKISRFSDFRWPHLNEVTYFSGDKKDVTLKLYDGNRLEVIDNKNEYSLAQPTMFVSINNSYALIPIVVFTETFGPSATSTPIILAKGYGQLYDYTSKQVQSPIVLVRSMPNATSEKDSFKITNPEQTAIQLELTTPENLKVDHILNGLNNLAHLPYPIQKSFAAKLIDPITDKALSSAIPALSAPEARMWFRANNISLPSPLTPHSLRDFLKASFLNLVDHVHQRPLIKTIVNLYLPKLLEESSTQEKQRISKQLNLISSMVQTPTKELVAQELDSYYSAQYGL